MKLAKSVLVASALALAVGAAYAAKDDDKSTKGFNNMDKDADGMLTRAEAKGNKDLLAKWKEADKNNDGKLSRAEYLTTMVKKDASTVKEKVVGAGGAAKEEVKEAQRRTPKADASTGATTKESGKPQ